MRTILSILILLVSIQALKSETFKVKPSELNVRSLPIKNSKIIGKLKEDELVEVLTDENGWSKIQYESGFGYVSSKQLLCKSLIDQINRTDYWGKFIGLVVMFYLLVFFMVAKLKTVRDMRFRTGKREIPLTFKDYKFIAQISTAILILTICVIFYYY